MRNKIYMYLERYLLQEVAHEIKLLLCRIIISLLLCKTSLNDGLLNASHICEIRTKMSCKWKKEAKCCLGVIEKRKSHTLVRLQSTSRYNEKSKGDLETSDW